MAQVRTKIESYSGSSSDDEWFEHKATRVGHDILFQLFVFCILILHKKEKLGVRSEL